MRSVLDVSIDSLPLTPSAKRRLQAGSVLYVGDLLPRTESGLLRIHNFGRKSLREIRGALAALGLHLDMDVGKWTPPTPGAARAADTPPCDPGA
jgi:DNA-directed RNA polymerase subunit alpha